MEISSQPRGSNNNVTKNRYFVSKTRFQRTIKTSTLWTLSYQPASLDLIEATQIYLSDPNGYQTAQCVEY
jgi:hypothetical protein